MTEALNRAPTGDSARGPGVDETPGPHPLTRRRPESSTSAHATSQASWFRFPRFSKSADTPGEGVDQRSGAVVLQQREAGLDVRAPARRTAVDQLGQPRFGRSPELPETLALEVQAAARAPHAVEHRGAMLGQQAGGGRAPRMANDQARLREDLDAILVRGAASRPGRWPPAASSTRARRD